MYSRHYTLTANTVTTVTMDTDYNTVEVLNVDGVAPIEFTINGATPTTNGNNQYYLPAAVGGLTVEAPGGTNTVVRLISTGTPKVYVRGS